MTQIYIANYNVPMPTILQTNLKNQLEKQSITVAELERRTGLRHAVINIMRGRSKNPSIKVAHALAKELDCSIEDLISNEANVSDYEKSINKVQQDPIWEPTLARQIFEIINTMLAEKKPNFHEIQINQIIEYWREAYNYCYGSPKKTADRRFIEWLIERNPP